MKPIRVCCFCERWESGGIESFLCNMLLHMHLSKLEVDIVAAQIQDSIFTQPLRDQGIRFYELSGQQNCVLENHRMFRELLRREKYDVVHLNIFHGLSLYYAHLAKQEHVPIRVAHSHNTALRQSRTRALKQMVHRVSRALFTRCVTDLWACSGPAAKFMFPDRELEQRGFRFIPNGIDTDRFRFDAEVREKVRTELGVQGKYVVGSIGRLCYQKNQSFLLDVFAEVLQQRPDSVLLLVGEGPDRLALEEKAKRLGVVGSVIFHGMSDRVERLLWAMDAFVMPSRFEGLPVTGVEAQASGTSCLFSGALTRKCKIEENTKFLSLSAPAAEWADSILKETGYENRAKCASDVRQAGFDVVDVAGQIERFYLRAESYGRAKDFCYCAGLSGRAVPPEVLGQCRQPDVPQSGDHSG